ncbi:MAG TPA: histidine kinase [Anaeromyxobacteraceae bacterium]|nr:histidine kinase [Anaeromyxobacteraceae bacterium]
MIADGSAFLDRAGRVLAVDGTFLALLRIPSGGATDGLRRRATRDQALAAFLAGDGPDALRLAGEGGAPDCELVRVAGEAGLLLRALPIEDGLGAPASEYAMQAVLLARLAGSLAHEVKNPLNAMALQLALLGDKIGAESGALATACASNLASLKNQIGRVNEVVRRYLDVADPPSSGGFDAGSLLCDATQLLGHEARRRRVAVACEAQPGAVRAAGDPARAARLVLGLLWRALVGTPEGGRLLTHASIAGGEVTMAIEHGRAWADPSQAWMDGVVAAGAREMGGRLDETSDEDTVRVALTLPKERPL